MTDQFNEITAHLETWYRSERGQYLLAGMQSRLDSSLETLFGYHFLHLGPLRTGPLFGECRIHHRIRACEHPGEGVGLVCEGDELPLESDSIDVIVAHHALELSPNPHQVLRELQRVLTPQGHLFLIGWNPYSVHGLVSRLRGLSPRSPWRNSAELSLGRLEDWLNLLGCEVEDAEYLYHIPLVGKGRFRAALAKADQWCAHHNLPLGGMYMVHAIKQVRAGQWPRGQKRREKFIGLSVPSPVTSPGTAAGLPKTGGVASRKKNGPVLH